MSDSIEPARSPSWASPAFIAVIGLALFAATWRYADTPAGAAVDQWVLARNPADGRLTDWMVLIRDLGEAKALSLVAAAALPIALFSRRYGLAIGVMALSYLSCMALTSVLKNSIAEKGPEKNYLGAEDPVFNAFPSGHTVSATLFYGLAFGYLATRVAKTRVERVVCVAAALTLMIGVGVCQTLLGAHWVLDVVAGWALGGAWLAGTVAVARWWTRRRAVHAQGGGLPVTEDEEWADLDTTADPVWGDPGAGWHQAEAEAMGQWAEGDRQDLDQVRPIPPTRQPPD